MDFIILCSSMVMWLFFLVLMMFRSIGLVNYGCYCFVIGFLVRFF